MGGCTRNLPFRKNKMNYSPSKAIEVMEAQAMFASGNFIMLEKEGFSVSLTPEPKRYAYFCTGGTTSTEIKLKSSTAGVPVFGQIYKNGGTHGTQRLSVSGTGESFFEDLSWTAGDTCTLYLWTSNAGTNCRGIIRLKVAEFMFIRTYEYPVSF